MQRVKYIGRLPDGNLFRALDVTSRWNYLTVVMNSTSSGAAVGIDIVSVPRVQTLLRRYPTRFATRILGRDEMTQFLKRTRQGQFLAGRFAAKEALIKALRGRLTARPAYNDLQIINDLDGSPQALFSADLRMKLQHATFSISISHDGDYACAVALCQPRPE